MAIEQDLIGTTSGGQPVARFTLTNDHQTALRVIALGATAAELHVRDRHGELADVVLGFGDVTGYETNVPYFGCTTGRVANRISGGRLTVDGETYQLAINEPPDLHLHGGVTGLNKRLWRSEACGTHVEPAVRFSYTSPDGEESYPGSLDVAVTYTLTEGDGMQIEYEATADKPTPVNLTNHSYFNLAGHDAGPVGDHVVTILARETTEQDAEHVPTGRFSPVADTPLDFTSPHAVGERLHQLEGGYDHNYVLDHGSCDAPALSAEVYEPRSGRRLEVYTTEPGVQLYTGNFLNGIPGKGGATYDQHHGLCLETQHYPDSVNRPEFPSIILRPGQTYRQVTDYRFSTR
ncbi:aldose epimerase family protein [Candidatus Latescibacterota bacterium]